MKFNYKILLPFLFLGVMAGSLFTSCEKECLDCGCSSIAVEKIVSSDSLDTPLQQLTPNSTIAILGTGLSMVNNVYLVGPNSEGLDVIYPITLNPSYVTESSIIVSLPKERIQDGSTYITNRLVLESKGCSEPYVVFILKPAMQ